MHTLKDKIAVITGAAGGIGAATAHIMARSGAKLALADIRRDAAEKVVEEIKTAGGSAIALELDLAHEESIVAALSATIEAYGRIDVLNNNAALLTPEISRRDGNVEEMEAEVWDSVFRINVRGAMLCCKHALKHMVARGSGSIINTASNLALQGNVIQAAYSASKAAMLQLTRSIATSHGRSGIRCNAVSPGLVLTPAARAGLPPKLLDIVASETLTPYLGEPDDIGHVVAFLASDLARYVTGQNFVADGGTASHVPGFSQFRALFDAS